MTDLLPLLRGLDAAELRVRIQDALLATLVDTYDCTRVWSAWGYGTMDENDFTPALDRLDEIIDEIAAKVAIPLPAIIAALEQREALVEAVSRWSDDWKRTGYNGALEQAQRALRFLAENDRPSGGEQFPNSACCYMIADELARTQAVFALAFASPKA